MGRVCVMWRNPKYAQPEPSPQAPEPSGRLIASCERPGRGRDPDAELRTTLDEYKGNPFLTVRVWLRGNDGGWFPTKKGITVRLGEVEDVAAALIEGARLAHLTPARLPSRPPTRERVGRSTRPEPNDPEPGRPTAPDHHQADFDPDFDEF